MNLPNEKTIVRRALSLGAFIARGEIENMIHNVDESGDIEQLERSAWDITNWIENEGLNRHQSRIERCLINKLPGTWKHTDIASTAWRTDALGSLLWALSYFEELPPYDMKFNRKMVLDTTGILSLSDDFAQCAMLRPLIQLRHARAVAELWHWRSRTRHLQNGKSRDVATSISAGIIQEAAENAYIERNIPRPIEGDFPAFGKPYGALTPKEHSRMASIAYERHFAFNWLCGYSLDWDTTPTDT
jgi:hypothetical protein